MTSFAPPSSSPHHHQQHHHHLLPFAAYQQRAQAAALPVLVPWVSYSTGLLVAHPLDTLRVRWQCLGQHPMQTLRIDGARSLYAGISTPLASAPSLLGSLPCPRRRHRLTPPEPEPEPEQRMESPLWRWNEACRLLVSGSSSDATSSANDIVEMAGGAIAVDLSLATRQRTAAAKTAGAATRRRPSVNLAHLVRTASALRVVESAVVPRLLRSNGVRPLLRLPPLKGTSMIRSDC